MQPQAAATPADYPWGRPHAAFTADGRADPPLMCNCVNEINQRRLKVQGIYCVSMAKLKVEKLCQAFENGAGLVELTKVHLMVFSAVFKLTYTSCPSLLRRHQPRMHVPHQDPADFSCIMEFIDNGGNVLVAWSLQKHEIASEGGFEANVEGTSAIDHLSFDASTCWSCWTWPTSPSRRSSSVPRPIRPVLHHGTSLITDHLNQLVL